MDTLKLIQDVITQDMARESEGIMLYEAIIRAAAKFDGKKITKAVATAVQKELGDGWYVYYDTSYGMYSLNINRIAARHDAHRRFLIGYDSNPVFRIGKSSEQHSGFAYYSNCYGDAARERNRVRQAMLDHPTQLKTMSDNINQFKIARDALQQYDGLKVESWYSIRKATGLDDK